MVEKENIKSIKSVNEIEEKLKEVEIENKDLKERIRELEQGLELTKKYAFYDDLTSLYNRNTFELLYGKRVEEASRYHTPLSLIFIDVDDFKQINDQFGHLAGDVVLKRIGKVVLNNIRSTDLGVRWAGDEFVVLLPNTKLDGARILACRIAKVIREEIFSFEDTRPKIDERFKVEISYSAVEYQKGEAKESFFKRADAQMYKEKNLKKSKQ